MTAAVRPLSSGAAEEREKLCLWPAGRMEKSSGRPVVDKAAKASQNILVDPIATPWSDFGSTKRERIVEVCEVRRECGQRVQTLVPDGISAMVDRPWNELFRMRRSEVEALQLESARARFREQSTAIKILRDQAERTQVRGIDRLEDIIPLLFQESAYKSYPVSLIEKGRFELLTKWLAGYTTLDLSQVDVTACTGIDDWLSALDAQTPLRVVHTSGTTGKLAFLPRSIVEEELWFRNFVRAATFRLGSEASIGSDGDDRLPMVAPMHRHGRYVAQRNLRYVEERVTPSPDELYCISNGALSADLVSLSGRIRIAQAKGELSQLNLPQPLRQAMRQYLQELERRPQESAAFFDAITEKLQGRRVFINAPTNLIYGAAVLGLERGLKGVFSPDSIAITGGGGKDVKLPSDWLETLRAFTGISNWQRNYGLSETIAIMPMCEAGDYHIQPYLIPFLLDPATNALLPREGVVTGRFAFLDLLAQTMWGGMISGDRITIDWNGDCDCGRTGPRIHDDIMRYSTEVTGEDKISCAATVDMTDAALKHLLSV